MLLQAFLVGLAAAIGQSDYLLGTAMVERPIVLGAIVGIFLGDIPTGVIVGFQLELAFMGVWQVGAAAQRNCWFSFGNSLCDYYGCGSRDRSDYCYAHCGACRHV